jgi:hypothetical protein
MLEKSSSDTFEKLMAFFPGLILKEIVLYKNIFVGLNQIAVCKASGLHRSPDCHISPP